MKKTLIVLLSALMIISICLAGCQSSPQQTANGTAGNSNSQASAAPSASTEGSSQYPAYFNPGEKFPIVKAGNDVTIKVTTVCGNNGGKTEDIWFWKFCEQQMNLKFDVEQVMSSAIEERKNLMFASGDLRDVIFNMGITTADLASYGQGEKLLMNIAPYLTRDIMPNMLALLGKFPTLQANMSCSDGGMYTLPKIGLVNDAGTLNKLFINTTWLKAMGMNMPQTLDEFHTVLKAFQEKDPSGTGQIIPLGGNNTSYSPSIYILSSLGFVTSGNLVEPALLDGKSVIPCGSEQYAEYVAFMNKLYTEGLMHPDFYTLDDTQVDAQMAEKRVGVLKCPAPYLALPNAPDFQQYEALVPATGDNGKKIWSSANPFIVGTIVVSSKCAYPEATFSWLDYFFSQQGGVYLWNGAPKGSGDTLDMYEGWYFDDKEVLTYKEIVDGTYKDELSVIQAIISPFSGTLGNRSDILNDKRVVGGLEPLDTNTFNPDVGDGHFRITVNANVLPYCVDPYPIVYFSEEDNTRISDLKTVINDFVTKETAKFVTGANPLSNIDQYYSDLKTLGFEEYQKYYVDAYTSYLENVKK